MNEPANRQRLVYLAHATEDKRLAKPLAEGLVERGIPVLYDNWEIGYGDSLRRKMEQEARRKTSSSVIMPADFDTSFFAPVPWPQPLAF